MLITTRNLFWRIGITTLCATWINIRWRWRKTRYSEHTDRCHWNVTWNKFTVTKDETRYKPQKQKKNWKHLKLKVWVQRIRWNDGWNEKGSLVIDDLSHYGFENSLKVPPWCILCVQRKYMYSRIPLQPHNYWFRRTLCRLCRCSKLLQRTFEQIASVAVSGRKWKFLGKWRIWRCMCTFLLLIIILK